MKFNTSSRQHMMIEIVIESHRTWLKLTDENSSANDRVCSIYRRKEKTSINTCTYYIYIYIYSECMRSTTPLISICASSFKA